MRFQFKLKHATFDVSTMCLIREAYEPADRHSARIKSSARSWVRPLVS